MVKKAGHYDENCFLRRPGHCLRREGIVENNAIFTDLRHSTEVKFDPQGEKKRRDSSDLSPAPLVIFR
tara:strand:- start:131474 stop:131677 length:204 start_codon:yes stop_codon:yes gene_type:complete